MGMDIGGYNIPNGSLPMNEKYNNLTTSIFFKLSQ